MARDMRLQNGVTESPAVDQEQQSDELALARARIAELEAENKGLSENAGSSTGNFPISQRQPSEKKKRWTFEVSVIGKSPFEPATINACDETEAMRLYVLQASKDGKPVDTVKWTVKAVCTQPAERRAYGLKVRVERNLALGYPINQLPPQAVSVG